MTIILAGAQNLVAEVVVVDRRLGCNSAFSWNIPGFDRNDRRICPAYVAAASGGACTSPVGMQTVILRSRARSES